MFELMTPEPVIKNTRITVTIDARGLTFSDGVGQVMGYPEFIEVRTLSTTKEFGIGSCEKLSPYARPFSNPESKKIKRLCSSSLSSTLCAMINYDIENRGPIRLEGIYESNYNAVNFDLKKVIYH